jgi:hypothetical protein
MQRKTSNRLMVIAAALAAAGIGSAARADLTSFTPGDLVVLDGTSQAEDTGTVPAVLLEYTPSGTLVGQLTVPSTTSGTTNALTLDNASAASHEGVLTLSENGQWLTFAGYDAPAGSTAATNDGTGTIAEINLFAPTLSVNTTTTIANETGASGTNVRAATTIDGNEFWVAQSHASASPNPGGLTYISGTGASATPTSLGDTLDPRDLAILGGSNPSTGVLVAGSGSSSFDGFGGSGHGVYGLTGSGGGVPTTTPISGTQINSDATDGSGLIFTNEPGDANSYHGYNTLFVAGNTSAVNGFIEKYEYNGTQFLAVGSIVDTTGTVDPVGLTTQLDPTTGNVDIFYTEPNGIYELNTPNVATSGFISSTSTLVVSAPSDSAFYGIANVPEPTTVGLVAVSAVGLLARRRSRKA